MNSEGLKAVHEAGKMMEGRNAQFLGLFESFQNKLNTGGFVRQSFHDEGSSTLMRIVESGMGKLKADVTQEEFLLAELINSVIKSFAPDTTGFKQALKANDRKKQFSEKVERDLASSMGILFTGNAEMYVAFRKLIEMIYPMQLWSVWYPVHRLSWV